MTPGKRKELLLHNAKTHVSFSHSMVDSALHRGGSNWADSDPYGYLLVHFIEDPNGYAERIYFDLSQGDDPVRWTPLNAGKPILTSSLGTTGVRDPYLVRDPQTGAVYLIATDLRVYPERGDGETVGEQHWDEWSHHGSTNLIVWKSDDLVHWSDPWTLDVSALAGGAHAELGMAWAPECLWVDDYYPAGHEGGRGAFVLYWSSKLFAADDLEHRSDEVYDRILWGVTRDFTNATYEYGGVFIDVGEASIDTTMLQRNLPDGTLRTYRATKNNGRHANIWLDYTDARRWWEPSTVWTTIQHDIGSEWTPQGQPGGVEGPALFASHGDGPWYLLVDVIPTVGYRPMVAANPDHGFDYLRDDRFFMAPHTKHGGVLSLQRAEYQRLTQHHGLAQNHGLAE